MISVNGFDNFKKYLLKTLKDKDYIVKNLKDIVDDNMLEAEYNTLGIEIKVITSKDKILFNYNISYGENNTYLIEHFKIIKINN